MNKTAVTVAKLHSVTFTIFFVINVVLTYFVYPKLNEALNSTVLSILIDAVVAAGFYSLLYYALKALYVLVFLKLKKGTNYLSGEWYHVHIKRDMHSFIATDKLRAGVTKIKQNLYDLSFSAENAWFSLDENGELVEDDNPTNRTHWSYCAVSREGDRIIGCYRAGTGHKKELTTCPYCGSPIQALPVSGEKKDRIGMHNLTVISENEIRGTFADEYPSASYGEIYFFRSREERDKVIKDFLADGKLDGKAERKQGENQ